MKNSLLKSMSRFLLLALVLLPLGAFAETTTTSINLFQPTPGDLSIYFLGQIFGTVGGVLHGTGGQLLGQILGIMNTGIVLVMGIFISYSVFLFVVNTSQDGEMMANKGKSTIFLAFRTAAGFALAIPSKATGYCLAQTLVMWMVVQGVGLADHAWGRVVDYVTQEGGTIYSYEDNGGQTVKKDDIQTLLPAVNRVLQAEVCLYKVKNMQEAQGKASASSSTTTTTDQADLPPTNVPTDNSGLGFAFNDKDKTVTFGSKNSKYDANGTTSEYTNEYNAECGTISYDLDNKDRAMGADDYTYKKAAITQVILDLMPIAKKIADTANNDLSSLSKPEFQQQASYATMTAATDYANLITPLRRKSMVERDNQIVENSQQGYMPIDPSHMPSQALQNSKAGGWILAGGYYRTLTSVDIKIKKSMESLVPGVDPATAVLKPDNYKSSENVFDSFDAKSDDMTTLKQMLKITSSYLLPTTQMSEEVFSSGSNSMNFDDPMKNIINKALATVSLPSIASGAAMTALLPVGIDGVSGPVFAGILGSMNDFFNYWKKNIGTSGDPMNNVQKLGGKMMEIAGWLWLAVSMYASAIAAVKAIMSSINPGFSAIETSMRWIMPICTAFMAAFFGGGILLGVYVPLIPVLIFGFAAIGWMVAVLEAMIAAPLVALGVTHPEAHDILGKAEQAIMLVFGVFLRPILIIIGLLAGMLLAGVGIKFFNLAFALGVGKLFGMIGSGIFSKVFTLFGVLIVYVLGILFIINASYNLIPTVVNNVLQWLGITQQQTGFENGLQDIKGGITSAGHTGGQAMGSSTSQHAEAMGRSKQGGGEGTKGSGNSSGTNAGG